MAFTIYIKNDGDTGTVTVSQRINDNENLVVFKDILDAGQQIQVQARYTESDHDERGKFDWHHQASGLTGLENVKTEDVLPVE